jgi:uncharacterized protein (DUF983 family)
MGNLLNAILLRCPRCEKGQIFKKKKYFEMHTHCGYCQLKYEKEVGFFYGSMYISYALNIATFVVALILYYTFEAFWDWRWFMGIYVALSIMFTPFLYKLSRSIWLAIMVKKET